MSKAISYPLRRWSILEYRPNRWALDHVHNRSERYIAITTSRQIGKTWAAALEIDAGMTAEPDEFFGPPWVGVISYNFAKCILPVMRYISLVKEALGEDYIKVNMNNHEAVIPTSGARLSWMSSDDPDAGTGLTLSKLIVDEAQKVPDIVIEKLRPALLVRQASVRAFGTPDITPEQTWFRAMWMRGQEEDSDYHSTTLSWRENPWVSAEAVLADQKEMSKRMFDMLYEGIWVDASGSVFSNIDAALLTESVPYNSERTYVMAVDFGITDDFTVVIIGEEATRRAIRMERWSHTDSIATYERIHRLWFQHGKPDIVADASGGMGIAMIEQLRDRGMFVRGITFTASNKMAMVGRLQGALERGRIRYPKEWGILTTELKAYAYKETPSGKLGAEALSGYHDDCVAALILLNEGFGLVPSTAEQYNYTQRREDPADRAKMIGRIFVRL